MELRKVDIHNLNEILALSVDDWQSEFVAPNVLSLAEAYASISSGYVALPMGVYEDGVPIGFIMLGYGTMDDENGPDIAKGNYVLWRFMIDKGYQRRGFGRAALALTLDYVRTLPSGPAEYCWLSYEPENQVAKKLYFSAGFTENGQMCGEEIVAVLKL